MDINGLRAILIGGASGMAKATAERIVAGGGSVAILDREQSAGAEVGGIEVVIAEAVDALGGLDAAVNTAGGGKAGRTLSRSGPYSLDDFRAVIDLNLIGTFNTNRLCAQHMSQNEPNDDGERGVMINTASIAAFEGQIGQAAYSASKGGVVGMMLPLAREFAQFGIRVNTIAPGVFLTPMVAGMPEEVQDSLGKQVPFPPRLGRPEEYADAVEFIYGTTMVNGETIRVDGAIRMQPK